MMISSVAIWKVRRWAIAAPAPALEESECGSAPIMQRATARRSGGLQTGFQTVLQPAVGTRRGGKVSDLKLRNRRVAPLKPRPQFAGQHTCAPRIRICRGRCLG